MVIAWGKLALSWHPCTSEHSEEHRACSPAMLQPFSREQYCLVGRKKHGKHVKKKMHLLVFISPFSVFKTHHLHNLLFWCCKVVVLRQAFLKFLTCFNKRDEKKKIQLSDIYLPLNMWRGWQDIIPVLLSSAKLPSQCKSLRYSQHVCAQGALQAGDCSPLQSRATSPQWLNKVNENNKAQHDSPPLLIYPVFTGRMKGETGQMENLTSSVPQRRSHQTSDVSLLILVLLLWMFFC